MRGKIIRIFLKSLAVICGSILLLLFLALLAVQSFTFQTWLGHKAGDYLSKSLNTRVEIKAINIEFFRSAVIRQMCLLDQHKDTLFFGDIVVQLNAFNYKKGLIDLKASAISKATAKIIHYPNEEGYNFEFISRYFSSADTGASASKSWTFRPGDLDLDGVHFVYKDLRDSLQDHQHINYSDLDIHNIHGRIKDLRLKQDSIEAEVIGLRAKEQCGLDLKDFSGKVSVGSKHLLVKDLRLQCNRSLLRGDLHFGYKSWQDYLDFITKVNISSHLDDSTHVFSSDIAYFASALDGLNTGMRVAGQINGSVSDFRLQDIRLSFGDYTTFRGNISISGLPEPSSSYIHINAKKFSTHFNDLARLPSYPFNAGKRLGIPEQLRALGLIAYKGKFDGFMNDFTTFGNFSTALGELETGLSLRLDGTGKHLQYEGNLSCDNFDAGTLAGLSSLGRVSLKAELSGTGLNKQDLAASFKIEVQKLEYLGYAYKGLDIRGDFEEGLFNGLLSSLDTNALLDFNGSIDFNGKIPEMEFTSSIQRLDLNRVNLIPAGDSGVLSTQMFINTRGNSIDDLSGRIYFDNTVYKTTGRSYKLQMFDLELDQASSLKTIELHSAYLNAGLKGRYKLSTLPGAFSKFLYSYYPTFFPKVKGDVRYSDSLNFSMEVKNFQVIHQLFIKNYMLSKGSTVQADFVAAQNKMSLKARMPLFSYKGFDFRKANLDISDLGKELDVRVSTSELLMEDSVMLRNIELNTRSEDKDLSYLLNWDDRDSTIKNGRVKGRMSFNPASFDLAFDTVHVRRDSSEWKLVNPNTVSFSKNGEIMVNALHLMNHQQDIQVEGKYSAKPGDSLMIQTNALQLSEFNPLLQFFSMQLDGLSNGHVVFSNADSLFAFRGVLDVQHFKLNGNSLGQVYVKTDYKVEENYIELEGHSSLGFGDYFGGPDKDITFKGNYYLGRNEESIDIDFKANTANLRMLNPLLEGYLSIANGFVRGEGKVHGDPSHIKLESKLNLFQSEIKVDYTNVTYYASGEIEIMPDQIRFSDILLRDRNMRSPVRATLNGNIFHNNFENIRIDYDINYRNMLVLNTGELNNPLYYGKLYGSGNIGLYGTLNNLNMQVTDTILRNSKFVLPLDGPAELNEEEFIHFVRKDSLKPLKKQDFSGFALDMSLYVQPEAEATLIMDRKTGDMLTVQGQGILDLNINSLGKFDMTGEYVITEGNYLFTLKTLFNKKFAIDAGSSITWSGDPLNAEIDVVARYKQRASVAPLLNDTTGQYSARQPVDCKLIINGKLATPNIHFKVDVPNLETTAMARIDNVLSDESELNRQVFSFLLFGSFVTPQIYTTSGGGVSAGGAAAASGSEMLSNRASEFINSYFGNLTGITDMQLGVNYRPATGSSNEEFDVALSKQFMNNRINVDGNFGVNNNPNNKSTGLIGDITVEYKLSDDGKYRVKVFNETNDNTQVTIMGGPYTQGIGLFYREEFNTFRELMKSYRRKSKR
ncbi:MAG TPA: translocation/assembly module TamB domain-containing protein [Bacteroidia bacterium]|nr:translocation/assembly module TamB domain-containing protein [Bacteroidia bacterium]